MASKTRHPNAKTRHCLRHAPVSQSNGGICLYRPVADSPRWGGYNLYAKNYPGAIPRRICNTAWVFHGYLS